jgi:class 3 adenylate cyclase
MPQPFDNIIHLTESLEELSSPIDTFVLFIDLCDSTEFKQFCINSEIPDSVWIVRQQVFLSRCASLIKSSSGSITKTIGDEIMATFSVDVEPIKILRCVLDIFGSIENIRAYNKGKFLIKCKASIDFGETYNGDIIGNSIFDPIGTCIDRCARISKFASADEIVISKQYSELIADQLPKLGLEYQNVTESLKGLGNVEFVRIKVNEH